MRFLLLAIALGLLAAACDRASPLQPTEKFYAVRGTILDTADVPVAGAVVEIVNYPGENWRVLTDANGRFQLFNVQAGVRRVAASKDGYFTSWTIARIDHDIDVSLRIERGVPLVLGESIAGAVRQNDPVCDPQRYEASAPCGRFLLTPPADGTVEITLTLDDPSDEPDLALVSPFDEYLVWATRDGEHMTLIAPVNAGVHYEVRLFNEISSFRLEARQKNGT